MAKRWTFTGNYTAYKDGQKLGPWAEGDTVELDFDLAAWIYRDAPEILKEAEAEKPKGKAEDEDETRAKKAAPSNRQHRGSRDRGA